MLRTLREESLGGALRPRRCNPQRRPRRKNSLKTGNPDPNGHSPTPNHPQVG